MPFIFYIFAALLIYFSVRSLLGGFAFLRFVRMELAQPASDYMPFATVIAPCTGWDDGLSKNLRALLELDYPDYEVIFVVDDKGDRAVSVIEEIVSRKDAETQSDALSGQAGIEGPRPETSQLFASSRLCGKSLLVIAPKATDSSQKVANIREAVMHADERSEVSFLSIRMRGRQGTGCGIWQLVVR